MTAAFELIPADLVELMTHDELVEYEQILRAELAELDESGPLITGAVDPADFPATPTALAAALTEGREQARPHLDLIEQALADAAVHGRRRILINIGPRYGKTRRVRWCLLHRLGMNPDTRIIYASATDRLADEQTAWVRDQLEQTDLGVRPRRDSRAKDRWWVDGAEGGMLAAGTKTLITGFGADLLVIDDVHKDELEAQSPLARERVWEWYARTAFDRLEPGASIVIIMTRWHPQDLTGRLLAEQPGVWTHIRIPTVAEADDPLGRAPGELLWPERFDLEAVTEQRQVLGEAAFTARHQQRPALSFGALWQPEWIADSRTVPGHMPMLARTVVGVDPSGSAGGDECGIVVVGLGMDGDAYVLDDRSLQASPATWGTAAVRAALDHGAEFIVVEREYGNEQAEHVIRSQMRELLRSDMRLRQGRPPEVVMVGTGGAGKALRATPFAALYESGRVHHVDDGEGRLALLETQMTSWSGDGPSPDRLDALVHGLRFLLGPGKVAGVRPQRGDRWAALGRR